MVIIDGVAMSLYIRLKIWRVWRFGKEYNGEKQWSYHPRNKMMLHEWIWYQ